MEESLFEREVSILHNPPLHLNVIFIGKCEARQVAMLIFGL